ncbi:unnamed protein product [Periconia digitata]|uniref:Uncharacterized protein n=1 Tax=Periconia digitata TaxID=1303443 RepID=A0A9W4XTC8_9PLEO|nr:unnamed protein product [Periconia digitata]
MVLPSFVPQLHRLEPSKFQSLSITEAPSTRQQDSPIMACASDPSIAASTEIKTSSSRNRKQLPGKLCWWWHRYE